METNFKRHENILSKEDSALLVVDIQEKILKVMQKPDMVVQNTKKLIQGFKVLNIPIFYTEQYPKGLGPTTAPLVKELEGLSAIQKMSFSCFGIPDFFNRLKNNKVKQVVIAGIESHVCVMQTALDLVANDFHVQVPADATSSRFELNYNIALERLRNNGVEITTTESVLFELLDHSGTPEFKEISKIIK